jgi:hypothetical protein
MFAIKRAAGSFLFILVTSSLIFPSAVPAQKIVPVVDVGGGGCVMGGVRDGKWVKAEDMAPLMKGGERYGLYSLTSKVGEQIGQKPASEGAPCSETMYVKGLSKEEGATGLIAVGGNWNALPRVPKVESNNSPVYRAAVADLLKRNGIARPQVNIVKVLRVDLDGDGTEEVLINATRVKRWESGSITPEFDAGDYSVVLVRKVVRGKVQTIVLDGEYHPKAGRQEDEGPPNEYALSAVLDLNGDGQMEIIVQGGYYEGDWKTVYALHGIKVENIFGCGCGA